MSTQEIVATTGVSGSSLVVPASGRGQEGTTAQGHNSGAAVESVPLAGDWNNLITALQNALLATTGALDTTKVVDLTTAQTLTNKTLTSPALTTPVISGATQNARLDSTNGLVTTDTDGATITFNLLTGSRHRVILGGNRTLAISNAASGQMAVIDLIQDGTGSRTVTWFQGPGLTTTMTIATPAVLTTGQNIPTGTTITLSTTGALPTGLTAGTTYWYNNVSSTTGNLSTSLANCQAGTFIATSGTQSGVHTLNCSIRWLPSQTTPTLSTGKFVIDTFSFYIVDATIGLYQGYISGQGG